MQWGAKWLIRDLISWCSVLPKHNPDKTKQWLLNDVAAGDEKVPTLLVKLVGDQATVEDDENILAECVQRSKKGSAGLSIEKSKTSKQNIIVTLTCKDHDTDFEFAMRTNQPGTKHKLGQFIRLAFKYNGVVKKWLTLTNWFDPLNRNLQKERIYIMIFYIIAFKYLKR